MRLSTQLSKFSELSHGEQRFLLTAMAGLPLVWAGLRLFGLAAVQAWIGQAESRPKIAARIEDVKRLGALVNLGAQHMLGPSSCLPRSLLLVWLLRRKGIESQLRIGVRLDSGILAAHAWVEYGGIPANDRDGIQEHYSAFSSPLPLSAFAKR